MGRPCCGYWTVPNKGPRYTDEALPWVERPLTSPKYKIIDINQIGGAAQLVPLNPVRGGDLRR